MEQNMVTKGTSLHKGTKVWVVEQIKTAGEHKKEHKN
jgi:hypothetical protein